MKVTCGWARFFDPLRGETVARGRVSVVDPPLPCPVSGTWEGEVTFLRGYASLRRRHRDVWLLQFESGSSDRWVEVTYVGRALAPSGIHAIAEIRTYDERFPAQLTELGGDG